MTTPSLIQATDLERETGLGKDLLRKWRSRYGFPNPVRQDDGESGYSREQVRQLRLIKRLQDAGFRPAQTVGKPLAQLERLIDAVGCTQSQEQWSPFTRKAIKLLHDNDVTGLEAHLRRDLSRRGITAFIHQTAAPLTEALGEAWAKGSIEVYQEHLYTAVLTGLLYPAIALAKPRRGYPKMLFATPPEELHVIGLLMAQAVIADLGVHCIGLGPHMPIDEIEKAVIASGAEIVGLSFSSAYPERRIRPFLIDLRKRLPDAIEVWVGGAGASHIKRPLENVRFFSDLHQPLQAIAARVA